MDFASTESPSSDIECTAQVSRDPAVTDVGQESWKNEDLYAALLALTRCRLWLTEGQTAALHKINETVARTLNAARVSVWLFNGNRDAIVCEDLYELAEERHSDGQILLASEYPAYFRALEETETIAADDACRDARTCEFADGYLKPLGIASMLDTPIMIGGVLEGVMCVENVGPLRKWSYREQSFSISVANLVSLLITQHTLKRSEVHLRAIADSEPECVMVVSPQGELLDINPAGLRMIGAGDVNAVAGQPVFRFIHSDDLDEWKQMHESVCGGETKQIRFRMVGLDHQERWAEAHSAPLPGDDGGLSSMLSVVRDVTDSKLAEEKLREQSAMLTEAQRIGQMGSWALDVERKRVEWSETACGLFNIRPPETESGLERFVGFFPSDHRPGLERHLDACIEQSVPFDDAFPIVTTTGRRAWVRLLGVAAKDEWGRVVGVKGVVQDISGIKQAEEERDRLFNLSLDMLCVTDFDGKFELVNPAWMDSTGWSASELIGKNWLDFVHPEDREGMVKIADTMRSGKPVRDVASRFRCWDGAYRWLSWSSHPVVDSQQIFAVARDITEWKNNSVKLLESHRALQLLSRCNEALNHSRTEKDLLYSVCSLAVEVGGYRMAWVGYADDDEERSVIPMASAGDIHGYLEQIRVSWSEHEKIGCGPIGRTIRSGQVVVCEDVLGDESFEPWRTQAVDYGIRGVICLPLRDGSRTFGTLGLYSRTVMQAGSEEIRLLQDLADNLALGICNLRAQAERIRIRTALKEVAASASSYQDSLFFSKMAAKICDALGAQAGYIVRHLPGVPHAGRIVGSVVDGFQGESSVFLLEGTPFELLVESDDLAVRANVWERFPEAGALFVHGDQACIGRSLRNSSGQTVGFLLAVFREPFNASEYMLSAVRIFALRIAAELERQEADMRLREQASLIDKAQDAIVVRDLQHQVLYWNKGAERMYGWTAEEAMARPVTETLYMDPSVFSSANETTLAHGEWTGELEQWTKDGSKRWVECHWSLVRDDHDQPKSVLCINTDITERRKLERQFLRAQRIESIGTLAGGIAHDLNNVLAPIMMSIDLLRNYVTDSNGLAILDLMGASARRGSEMVRQVLSFARGVEGEAVEVQLSNVIADVSRIVEETFPKNIQLGVILQPDLWPVVADPTQLHQVLINLCVNARDAMPDGGQIIIKAENLTIDEHYASLNLEARCGHYLKIEVEDTGHGIDPEIIDKLFDPFFTTKEVGKGTGLGLSTSLAIVKSHGGFINAYSEPGMGARFRVYLPIREGLVDTPQQSTESAFPRGNGETVMVVDDEASIRLITQQTLEAFGYRVLLASDGSEAISTYVEHQNDIVLVITDMMMPVMDGASTIKVLRRLNPRMRIIAMSGIDSDAKEEKAARAGANFFLPKPYAADVLLKTIHSALTNDREAST